jgi:hypothetical protein
MPPFHSLLQDQPVTRLLLFSLAYSLTPKVDAISSSKTPHFSEIHGLTTQKAALFIVLTDPHKTSRKTHTKIYCHVFMSAWLETWYGSDIEFIDHLYTPLGTTLYRSLTHTD